MREAVVQFGRIGAVAPAPEIGEQRTNHPTRHGTPGNEVAGVGRRMASESLGGIASWLTGKSRAGTVLGEEAVVELSVGRPERAGLLPASSGVASDGGGPRGRKGKLHRGGEA